MTMHYGETVTAEEIWEGWKYHNYNMPLAFGTFTWGDQLAYNVWSYMARGEKYQDVTPEKFCANIDDEDIRNELTQLIYNVLKLQEEESVAKSLRQ